MKKIFFTIIFLVFCFSFDTSFWANCVPPEWDFNVSEALEDCLSESDLVNTWDASITGWFWDYITTWTNNIALYLWIFAVFAIVFGSFNLTISAWDDEKINKSKKIIQWWIIWFIGVISASLIINLIIRIIYDLS